MVVADSLIGLINPIQKKVHELLHSPDYLEDILEEGSRQAAEIAEKTWLEVKQRVGIDLNRKQKGFSKLASSSQEK